VIRTLFPRRGRVLRVRLGFNPNSSSVGFDVSWVEAGGAALVFATVVLSAVLRVRRARRHGQEE